MTVRLQWNANPEPDVTGYIVQRSDTGINGTYDTVATVTLPLLDDPAGTDASYYKIAAVDAAGNIGPYTSPFKTTAASSAGSALNVVSINHNTGGIDNLRYMGPGGTAVEAATIRLFKKVDFDAGNTETPVGTTLTGVDGRWVTSIPIVPGATYVVQFYKLDAFGPDSIEVTV